MTPAATFTTIAHKERAVQFTDAEVDAAARVLDGEGRRVGWWPNTLPKYDDLDAISKSEFGGLVEAMLRAAAKARDNTQS